MVVNGLFNKKEKIWSWGGYTGAVDLKNVGGRVVDEYDKTILYDIFKHTHIHTHNFDF